MGGYGVSTEELKPKLEAFLESLEGDTNAEELAKAYNMLSKEHGFGDTLLFHWFIKDMADSNIPFQEQLEATGLKYAEVQDYIEENKEDEEP